MESVSICGVTVAPWGANARSITWRVPMSGVSKASGNRAASAHVIDSVRSTRWSDASRTYLSVYSGTTCKPARSPGEK
jgi:hypothetical protein